LLFFQFGNTRIDHVAIYLGDNRILQAIGRCDCRLNDPGKQAVAVAVLSKYYTDALSRVLRFGNSDFDLNAFFVETCNVSSTCPTPGCLRAGRDYTLELSLRAGAAELPPGTTVIFRVNGTQLGGTVPFVGRYVDSDRNFLSVPFRPAASQ